MEFDTVSISSSDSDDVPLKVIRGLHDVPITSATLKTRSLQHCDFCEEVFLNKYEMLIHNAKHIIIPLIKRELHQCPLCLFYFTSRYKLKHHTRNKHKNDVVTLNNETDNVIKNDATKGSNENVNVKNDATKANTDKKHAKPDNGKPKHDNEKNKIIKEKVSLKHDITKANTDRNHAEADNDKPKHDIENNKIMKENVNLKHQITKGNNQNNVNIDNEKPKHDNEKNKDIKEKVNLKHGTKGNNDHVNEIVTIYESDDDLPLVNGNLKGTHVIKKTGKGETKCGTSILKEALLKDVKVVIEKIQLTPAKIELKPEKIELMPEKIAPQLSVNKVPEKLEVNIKSHNIQEVNEIEAKLVKIPDEKTKPNTVNTSPKVKISSRLRFEDDEDICDDEVMKDLTTDCIVDMNLFNEPWFDELAMSINNDDIDDINDDMIISLIDDDDDEEIPEVIREKEDVVVYSPSTHHDELVKPGVYRCRKCQQMFPTRFNQIQHEMSHIHIRKPRPVLCEHCDRFIANKKSLKVHMASKHNMQYRQRTYKTCTKCNLKYNNYDRHLENYHNFLRCHLCNRGFETEIDRLNHIRGHLVKIKCEKCGFIASELEIQEHKRRFHKAFVSLAEFNLCDVCCLFLRNKHNTHYVFGETVSQIGSRLDCEHCGNKFFHLTQVRRTVKGRPTDRFQFEKERERKKVLTNTERLKNIQQRLKMINKLSRF